MAAGRRTLVTGADGFIGSHLTEALVRQGHQVRAMAMYQPLGTRGWLDEVGRDVQGHFQVVVGDIRDPNWTRRAVQDCDRVVHLAALIAVPYSYEAPDSYVGVNVLGTLNVLQATRGAGVQRLVLASTSEVYGTAVSVPMTEDHRLCAQSPYAATKIAGDQLALAFHASFGTPVVIVRPFNTYGPRQSARAVIPSIISQVVSGKTSIRLGSVHPTRDFSYVDDVVAGFVAAALADDRAVGEIFNLGSGFEIAIGSVVAMVGAQMNAGLSVHTDAELVRPERSEVTRLLACTDKAGELLDWRPSYGGVDGFERGLRETIAWFQARPDQTRC